MCVIFELFVCLEKFIRFYLDKNMTGNEGIVYIVVIVVKVIGMKDFKMVGFCFFCEGVIMFVEVFLYGNFLERFDLNDNNVNEEGVEAFVKVLLKYLNF